MAYNRKNIDLNQVIKYGGIAVVLLLIKGFFKPISNLYNSIMPVSGDNSADFNENEQDEIQSYIDNRLSLTPLEISQYSQRLFHAMENYGTDVKEIYEVLSVLDNGANYWAVYNHFGLKGYSEWWGTHSPIDGMINGGKSLEYWIREEMSNEEEEWKNRILEMVNWLKDN